MPAEKLSLHTKLAQIMYEAERIPKNGTAPAVMGGYRFVQVGDAADYIRKALAEQKITMLPTSVQVVGQIDRQTAKGGTMTTVDLLMEWTLTDGDSGESITIMSFGAGADGGDKYSGKASTSAMKYALLTGFLLSTGDDTEGHTLPEQRPAGGGIIEVRGQAPSRTPEGGLIGKAVAQGNHDFNLRQTPDGWVLPFRVKDGSSGGFIVRAENDLARALDAIKSTVLDQRVTVWGHWQPQTIPAKGTKPQITYNVLILERIATPDGILPAPAFDTRSAEFEDLEEPPEDIELVGEAPSLPLGLDGEKDVA